MTPPTIAPVGGGLDAVPVSALFVVDGTKGTSGADTVAAGSV